MATTKELRKQRRREEHQAGKAADRATVPAAAAEQPPSAEALSEALDFAEDGPKSLADFLARRRRQTADRHGLSSDRFPAFEWENFDEFLDFQENRRAECQLITQTQALLVEMMGRLQDLCFDTEVPQCEDLHPVRIAAAIPKNTRPVSAKPMPASRRPRTPRH